MYSIDATYRLQLSPQFTFKDLDRILDYLDDIGITTIYSSPFFRSRKGSTHGYDVLDPLTINPEIGTLEQFRAIGERMKKKGMTWIQDIVPNHMAFDAKNPWLKDIFEIGSLSKFYHYFDVDWEYNGLHQLMAPFLGSTLEEALENREIKLRINEKGLFITYNDNYYPVHLHTYIEILADLGEKYWLDRFLHFPQNQELWTDLKNSFLDDLYRKADFAKAFISEIESINSSNVDIQRILEQQKFLLTHFKQTETEINYRRFFTINGLICLRMENLDVFEGYHSFIKSLCEEGLIHGLRIDHIDGLFDPEAYLERLRDLLGENTYIIVEKILEMDEKLPKQWPVQGTSGYDFLAQISHLFTQHEGEEEFTQAYDKISPNIPHYDSLIYQKKLFILTEKMGGELHYLWLLLKSTLLKEEFPRKEPWKKALSAILAAFPVYRIYPRQIPLKPKQVLMIESAYKRAIENFPELLYELDHLKACFMGAASMERDHMLYFLQRCQQFSGPLTAKGIEDTSFYIYNRLIAHNEVGDSPGNFGLSAKDFHRKMLQRNKEFPLSLSGTATHDTKRGEDSRMRLNVLSEIPGEWFTKVAEWKSITKKIRKEKNIPDNNEEYFIYQTLLGSMPVKGGHKDFLSRTFKYIQKMLREAKVHSDWVEPNKLYEKAVFDFVNNILEDEIYRQSFDTFLNKIARFGAIKSLSQTLIKITSPGIPDIYQGTELWDLSYVDPDNRRPVVYGLRTNYMADLRSFNKSNLKKKINSLKLNYYNGKLKMFVLSQALKKRRKEKEIFHKGEYFPLYLKGRGSKNFICFARILDENWRIIIAPIFVTDIFAPETFRLKKGILSRISIKLPNEAPSEWDNVFSGNSIVADGQIPLQDCILDLPVAILTNRRQYGIKEK